MFVELDTGRNAGYAVSLGWDRDMGKAQIVVADSSTVSLRCFPSEA